MSSDDSNDDTAAHDLDQRKRKYLKNASGGYVVPKDTKIEKAQDGTKADVARLLHGLAQKLDSDPCGQGMEIWNNDEVGNALQHLFCARNAHAEKYPIREDDFAAMDRPDAIPTSDLTPTQVKSMLSPGFVERLQDPMFYADENETPVLMVRGMRHDTRASKAAHGRHVSATSLTLLDGSGKIIIARVGMAAQDLARGLRQGYVIKLIEYHQYFFAKHDDKYSTAGIGLMRFEVAGFGNLPGEDFTAAGVADKADLTEKVRSEVDDDEAPEEDVFLGWDESKEKPPKPRNCCTVAGRACSMYGTLFFRSCVCEEIPVPDDDDLLKPIADKYFAKDRPVSEMTNNMKRNLLYWYYAHEVYHVRGWLHRMPLPSCLVFKIRMTYPNELGNEYVGFVESYHGVEGEEDEENMQ